MKGQNSKNYMKQHNMFFDHFSVKNIDLICSVINHKMKDHCLDIS